MDREIKFRAWCKGSKSMDYDAIYKLQGYIEGKYPIMEYTGLKDKNGKDIYEGDILEYVNQTNTKIFGDVIRYRNGWFAHWRTNGLDTKTIIMENSKIVGNIYENPELIDERSML